MVVNVMVVNRSSLVADDELRVVADALQRQVSEHLAPVWGRSAALRFVPMGVPIDLDGWILALVDDTPDGVGEPDGGNVTVRGQPVGRVRVRRGWERDDWTLAASHELLELLCDPHGTLTACQGRLPNGTLFALNVCDPCADRRFGYRIDGVLVSDFVWPAWFGEPFGCVDAPIRFDHEGRMRQPFALLEGGSAGVVRGGVWKRLSASGDEEDVDLYDRLGQRLANYKIHPDDGVWCFGRVKLDDCPKATPLAW